METLSLLIKKFQEVKEELKKELPPSPVHSTVEGFMGGLKALPKGSPERGKFVTAHMNHGPFLSALKAHPQGEQLHGMLTNHLNSTANAGFKPGKTQAIVKSSVDSLEELEKAYISAYSRYGPSKKVAPPVKPVSTKPTGSDKISAVAKEPIQGMNTKVVKPAKLTGLDRIKAESQKPISSMSVSKGESCSIAKNGQWQLDKNVNGSYSPSPNMTMGKKESISLSKNGQWSLNKEGVNQQRGPAPVMAKDGLQDAIKNLKSSTKVTSAMNTLRAGPSLVKDGVNAQIQEPMALSKEEDVSLEKKHVGFKKLQHKLEDEGKSKESAAAIAASIGRKKYGAKGMSEMAHKSEGRCPTCHASPCECQTTGVNVDKIDGPAVGSIGSGM